MLHTKLSHIISNITQKTKASFQSLKTDILASPLCPPSQRIPTQTSLIPITQKSAPKLLIERKKAILKQLKTIQSEIRRQYEERGRKSTVGSRISSQQSEVYEKASRLVDRMNKQRKQMEERKLKKEEKMQLQVKTQVDRVSEEKRKEGKDGRKSMFLESIQQEYRKKRRELFLKEYQKKTFEKRKLEGKKGSKRQQSILLK